MSDFSVELAAEQIVDPRTKDYFREVYNSYTNSNLRSAVVMLWSVVVCDLLFKLEDLDGRADPSAQAILRAVDVKKKASPTSPEWELLLVDQVKDRTHLLDTAEHQSMIALQKVRHLSAHPVLTGTYNLYSPNRETVRAHIRNALEAVLMKPALMSKKIFDAFTEDLERLAKVIVYGDDPEDPDLRRYLDATYFQRLSPAVAESLFRSLWKLAFKTQDARCEANRAINFRALRLLYRKHAALFLARARSDPGYYSDVALSGTPLRALVRFLVGAPEFYGLLTDAARVPLQKHLEGDEDQRGIAWFVARNLATHIDDMARRRTPLTSMSADAFRHIYGLAKQEGLQAGLVDYAIGAYTVSYSYAVADARFRDLLKPCLSDATDEQLPTLLAEIDSNSQTYGRSKSRVDHLLVKEACDRVLGATFDYGRYPNFIASIGLVSLDATGQT